MWLLRSFKLITTNTLKGCPKRTVLFESIYKVSKWSNPNPVKLGRCIKELERIYGIKVGNPNYEKNSQLKTQTQLATDMGLDVRTLQKYKLLAEMIPELSDLVDTGIVTKTTALAMMRNLSEQ